MASVHEYFIKDAGTNFTLSQQWQILDKNNLSECEVTARLHLDFEANARYISFFVPDSQPIEIDIAILLNDLDKILEWSNEQFQIKIQHSSNGWGGKDANNLVFTGQIYIYSEKEISQERQRALKTEATNADHQLTFFSQELASERNKLQRPLAFISHDNRDKSGIAG